MQFLIFKIKRQEKFLNSQKLLFGFIFSKDSKFYSNLTRAIIQYKLILCNCMVSVFSIPRIKTFWKKPFALNIFQRNKYFVFQEKLCRHVKISIEKVYRSIIVTTTSQKQKLLYFCCRFCYELMNLKKSIKISLFSTTTKHLVL